MIFSIALFQPDIAGNTGTILRLSACLNFPVHIIEPAGFNLSDKNLKRAAMDYLSSIQLRRHNDWDDFYQFVLKEKKRLIALTTKSNKAYYNFSFHPKDIFLFGSESAGLPQDIHEKVDERLTIPMKKNMRSINLAMSVAMVMGETRRQFPL